MQRRAVAALALGMFLGVAVLLVAGGGGGIFGGFGDAGAADGGRPTGPEATSVDAPDEPPGGSQSTDAIVETVEYRRLPETPGRVAATIHYAIPDNVASLRFQIAHGRYDVAATDGFDRTGGGAFVWNGTGTGASVTIRHDASESFRPEAADERYVGAGDGWAIVARPQTHTQYNYTRPDPGVEYRLTVDGEGRAGQRLAYLGPYRQHADVVDGEQLTLVVPDAADPASSPGDILDSLEHASDRLRVGNRNDEVVVIVAPTGEVAWGPPGLSIGADARIAADVPVDQPVNVWIHEYVHTRQYRDHRRPGGEAIADDAQWLVEGSADYYGALFNRELGHTDVATFRRVLARGTREPVTDAELADPGTWASDAAYEKGALVAAAIDVRLRAASDGEATLQQVLAEWNRQETFDAADVEAAVRTHGNASAAAFVADHTRTDATPTPRSREAHARYFDGDVAQFDYDATGDPPLQVTGPYREGGLPRTLVTGETVAASVAVENVGEVAGPYRAVLVADGETVATQSGRLSAGDAETVTLRHALDATGEVTLRAGGAVRTVAVREPAAPVVAEVTARPDRPSRGQEVDVVATVRNPSDRPATGTVPIEADGDRLAGERLRLAPNGTTTVETTTNFSTPGEHRIAVDDLGVTVRVGGTSTLDALAGYGVGTALVGALLATGLLARRHRA